VYVGVYVGVCVGVCVGVMHLDSCRAYVLWGVFYSALKLCVATIWYCLSLCAADVCVLLMERWGAGVETQKNVRGEVGGWGRVPFNEPYAQSLSTIYDGA